MRYLILFMLNIAVCHAAIYMQTNKDGSVTYSDTATTHSSPVVITNSGGSISTPLFVHDSSVEKKTETTQTTVTAPVKQSYKIFEILSPKDQETIQNQPEITVMMKLDPKLQSGDKIQLVLDGKLVGDAAASTQILLSILERGVHQLSAIIIDENKRIILQSNTITIYVHRNSVITSPAK
ncbi:MAG: hypothetical protein A3E83_00405 [Gammaproteobacteria bacterium RIFCSPHIGHO2_12_FULL_41_20]|nr:MAG: hypothetical protein A3E83_00405 [Gammaproteobacteria bacterium RIFCSPHIGHO2_12_FULL_41_20]